MKVACQICGNDDLLAQFKHSGRKTPAYIPARASAYIALTSTEGGETCKKPNKEKQQTKKGRLPT